MSRGHAAALPPPGWRPPERVTPGGLVVTFRPEAGGPERRFAFDDLPGSVELLQGFAAAFARLTAADGTHRSLSTAQTTYQTLRRFARRLANMPRPPVTARDLVPAHLAALRLASPRDYIKLKVVLRDVPGTSPAFAGALREANPPRRSKPVTSLAKAEFNAVMTAARHDIRAARTRIRANRELLARWHAGDLVPDSSDALQAKILDHIAVCSDVPREEGGRIPTWVARAGTVAELFACLHLTSLEMFAAAVLLVGMTGHNAAGLSNLTVEHTRADGINGDDAGRTATRVAIVDVTKPRRGRRRRYMNTALADIPDPVLGRLDGPASDLQTPFGLFATLCELTAAARQATGSNRLLIYLAVKGGSGAGRHWAYGFPATGSLSSWAAEHGLHAETDTGKPLNLTWPQLRLTYIRLHQRGVAHTDAVLANQYLLRDRGNINEYRQVVAGTLREQEAKARELGHMQTLTEDDRTLALTDPATAADKAGVAPDTLEQLLAGQLDTALAGCIDDLHSPFTATGSPCTASFLLCLRCPNARATPAHLPVQALAHQRILALRPAMPPDRWARRFGAAEAQLRHLLGQFPPPRVAEALDAATREHGELIDRLLHGDLDSR